jgi:aspartyl-tRNA(Asn)/glutamyl-tRNA(Gln) amidotransferase subunit C
MAITIDEVDRIAKLARLKFDDSDKQKLQQELSAILDYVDQLKEVGDKTGAEVYDSDALNLMRNDVAEVREPEEFLRQAPARQENFIKVKSVLD